MSKFKTGLPKIAKSQNSNMDQKSIAPRSTKTVPMKVPKQEERKNKKASITKTSFTLRFKLVLEGIINLNFRIE